MCGSVFPCNDFRSLLHARYLEIPSPVFQDRRFKAYDSIAGTHWVHRGNSSDVTRRLRRPNCFEDAFAAIHRCPLAFFAYHSRNVSFGISGRSRDLPQTVIRPGNNGRKTRATRAEKRNIPGRENTRPAAFIISRLDSGASRASEITCRHLNSCSWMLSFTGHTSVHDPHKVDAKGSELYAFRSRLGERMEPIGPGTVKP